MADHEADDAGDVVDAELAHQVRAVVLDRLGADIEFHRDFLARVALGQQHRDFFLPLGQRGALGVDVALRGGERIGHRLLEGLAEPGVAGGDGVDGLTEFGKPGALRYVATDASLEQAAGDLLLGLRGEDEYLEVGLRVMQLAEDFQPADAGEQDVQDEDVRLELLGEG